MEKRKNLNIIVPLLVISIIAIAIGTISLVLSSVNQKRADLIHGQYEMETLSYMMKNQQGIETLFSEVFPETACTNPDYPYCDNATQSAVMELISDDLKDFSSTSFIRINSKGDIIQMTLSGGMQVKVYSQSITNSENDLLMHELLSGERDEIPWDRYVEYRVKEVIVPVKNSEGKVIGAIVRGVIE